MLVITTNSLLSDNSVAPEGAFYLSYKQKTIKKELEINEKVKILEIKNYIKIILVSAGLGAVAAYISSNIQQEQIPIRVETIRASCRNGQIDVPRVFSTQVKNGQILPDYPIIEFFRAQGINVRQNMQIEIKYPTNCVAQREERELPRRRFPTKIRRENPTPFGTRVRLSGERVKIRLR